MDQLSNLPVLPYNFSLKTFPIQGVKTWEQSHVVGRIKAGQSELHNVFVLLCNM